MDYTKWANKTQEELDQMELELVAKEVHSIGRFNDAKVTRLASGYGYEIIWDGGEQCTIALVSWGQGGRAKLTIARTACDGGCSQDRAFGEHCWVETPEELAKQIAKHVRD